MSVQHSYPLSEKFSITFKLQGQAIEAIWHPATPKKRQLRTLLPSYRAARHAFLSDLGLSVLVVEL